MHYKHEWFERTLINASAKKTLAEAAPEWVFAHFGAIEKGYDNCQICHARIVKFVAIRNTKNNVYLLIGEDCYDKLLHYLKTQKIETVTLMERRQYIVAIKKYCKKFINASFIAWFKARKRISEEIRKSLTVIEALGYAPSLKAAEELVEYYKAHRRFPLYELLTKQEQYVLRRYPCSPRLPKTLTLNILSEVQNRIREWADQCAEREFQKLEGEQRRKEEERRKKEKLEAQERAQGIFPLRELLTKQERDLLWQYPRRPRLPEKLHKDRLPKVRAIIARWQRVCQQQEARRKEKEQIIWEEKQRKDQIVKEVATTEIEEKIRKQPDQYLKCHFWRGINPTRKIPQWEFKRDWVKYVLDRDDDYDPAEGLVYVEVTREMVPDKVYLVMKLRLEECYDPVTREIKYEWI